MSGDSDEVSTVWKGLGAIVESVDGLLRVSMTRFNVADCDKMGGDHDGLIGNATHVCAALGQATVPWAWQQD